MSIVPNTIHGPNGKNISGRAWEEVVQNVFIIDIAAVTRHSLQNIKTLYSLVITDFPKTINIVLLLNKQYLKLKLFYF